VSRRPDGRHAPARHGPPGAAALVGLVTLAASWAGAGAAAAEELTLRAAIERALGHNPAIDAVRRERARAEAGVDRARAGGLPRLEGSYGYWRSDQPVFAFGSKLNQGRFTEADFEVSRLNDPGATGNFRAGLTLSQPIYAGGRVTLGVERATIAREVADLAHARTIQEIAFQTARAYWGLRLAEERLATSDAALRAAEANRELAEARVRAGLAVEADRLAAQVRTARLQEDVLTARSQLGIAQATLNDAMGTALDLAVSAIDPFPAPAAPAPPEVESDALGRRPDHRAVRLREDLRDRDVQLAQAEFLPTVGVEGSYELNGAQPFSEGQGSWTVMAVLRWNFLAGGADRARVREAEAARAQARALSARHASQVGLEVRTSQAQLAAARGRVGVAGQAAGQAEEVLRIIRIRYRGGLATIVDLLAAEAAVTAARLRQSEALHDAAVAALGVELALGRLDPGTVR
jgi:outer membrane protein TolC